MTTCHLEKNEDNGFQRNDRAFLEKISVNKIVANGKKHGIIPPNVACWWLCPLGVGVPRACAAAPSAVPGTVGGVVGKSVGKSPKCAAPQFSPVKQRFDPHNLNAVNTVPDRANGTC